MLHDGVVVVLVIQLHDLNEVVEASLVLGVLAGLEHGEDVSFAQDLLSLLLCSSNGLDGLHGGVDVAGLEHGEDVSLAEDLLSFLLCSSNGLDGLHGGVDVAGPHQVTGIEGINLAISLEVIDVKGEVKSFDFLLLESK